MRYNNSGGIERRKKIKGKEEHQRKEERGLKKLNGNMSVTKKMRHQSTSKRKREEKMTEGNVEGEKVIKEKGESRSRYKNLPHISSLARST